jgi:hypothetical protein
VPSIVTAEEAERYNALGNCYYQALMARDDVVAQNTLRAMDEVGRFPACFVHHPEAGGTALYPTLPTDMANLIQIFAEFERSVAQPATARCLGARSLQEGSQDFPQTKRPF